MHFRTHLAEIDAVTRTEIDPELVNPLADGLEVSQIPRFDSVDPAEDNRFRFGIERI